MSLPSAEADPADPNLPAPQPAGSPPPPWRVRPPARRRPPHLRAVRSPGDEPAAATASVPGLVPLWPAPPPVESPVPVESPARAPRGANAAYVGVLLIVVSAVVATATTPGHWLRATLGLGAGVGIAAAARALLPARYAGLLAVRGRRFDAFCLGALAVLIVTVGLLIPR